MARGSELWMFSDVPIEDRERRLKEDGLGDLENLRLVHRVGNAVIRRHLESLPLENFDSVSLFFPFSVDFFKNFTTLSFSDPYFGR